MSYYSFLDEAIQDLDAICNFIAEVVKLASGYRDLEALFSDRQ